jgi:hypothetical protein
VSAKARKIIGLDNQQGRFLVMPHKKMEQTHPDFPHGVNAGYSRGCKCAECKLAHSLDVKKNYLKNHPEPKRCYKKHGGDVSHPDFPHGLFSGYIAGCRCEKCLYVRRNYNLSYGRTKRCPGTIGGIKKAAYNAVYRKSKKGLVSSRKGNATRAARKRNAIIGLNAEEQKLILRIYEKCPIGFEVDHIIPLACGGSHTSNNLQYLPMSVNRRKNKRLDLDVSSYVVRWQEILEVPSTIIPLRGVELSSSKHTGP